MSTLDSLLGSRYYGECTESHTNYNDVLESCSCQNHCKTSQAVIDAATADINANESYTELRKAQKIAEVIRKCSFCDHDEAEHK